MSTELASLSSVTLELDKVAPFLIKLFEIVSSPASDYLICWSDHGDSFRIIDRTKFAQVRAWVESSASCTTVYAIHCVDMVDHSQKASHASSLSCTHHSIALRYSFYAGHSTSVLQA